MTLSFVVMPVPDVSLRNHRKFVTAFLSLVDIRRHKTCDFSAKHKMVWCISRCFVTTLESVFDVISPLDFVKVICDRLRVDGSLLVFSLLCFSVALDLSLFDVRDGGVQR